MQLDFSTIICPSCGHEYNWQGCGEPLPPCPQCGYEWPPRVQEDVRQNWATLAGLATTDNEYGGRYPHREP